LTCAGGAGYVCRYDNGRGVRICAALFAQGDPGSAGQERGSCQRQPQAQVGLVTGIAVLGAGGRRLGAVGGGADHRVGQVHHIGIAVDEGDDLVVAGGGGIGGGDAVAVSTVGYTMMCEKSRNLSLPMGGKAVGLFGSFGWGDGEWMRSWEKDCDDAGINRVCGSITCCEAPDDDVLAACQAMGRKLAE